MMKVFNVILYDDGEPKHTIATKEQLHQLMLLLKDSKFWDLKKIEIIPYYQDCDDIIKEIKEEVKPKDLETSKKKGKK